MEVKKHKCFRCSLECNIGFEVDNGLLKRIIYSQDGSFSNGRLCKKGNLLFVDMQVDRRLCRPFMGNYITHKQAYSIMDNELKDINKDEIGLILNDYVSEEVCEHLLDMNIDIAISPGLSDYSSSDRDIPFDKLPDNIDCQILFGDVVIEHPVISKNILDNKYTARKNKIISFTKEKCNTEWFSNLKYNIEDIEQLNGKEVKEIIDNSKVKVLYIAASVCSDGVLKRIEDFAVKNDCKIVRLFVSPLVKQYHEKFKEKTVEISKLSNKKILIVFGAVNEDIINDMKNDFNIVFTQHLLDDINDILLMPSSYYLEEKGTYNGIEYDKVREPASGAIEQKKFAEYLKSKIS